MPTDQLSLFAEAPAPAAYVPDAQHVRNRLEDMLGLMQGAALWPYLLALLPDPQEAARWRGEIEAQAARLDGG